MDNSPLNNHPSLLFRFHKTFYSTSLLLLVLFITRQVIAFSWVGSWFVSLHLLYLLGSLSLLKNSRIGWWICVLMPLAIMARFLPPVLRCLFLYLINDQRLADSPGTILVTLAIAVLFIIPAFTIILIEARLYRRIGNRLVGIQGGSGGR